MRLFSLLLLLLPNISFSENLTCDQLATIGTQTAKMRENGFSKIAVCSQICGHNKLVDAVVDDVYKLKLSEKQARNHVMSLCLVSQSRQRAK